MRITWNRKAMEKTTPQVEVQLGKLAQGMVDEANRSARGRYYAWTKTQDGVRLFRGTRKPALVELGNRAIQGGRHLKRAMDRRRQ